MGQQVDYAALAEQARGKGTSKYDVLADQARKQNVTAPTSPDASKMGAYGGYYKIGKPIQDAITNFAKHPIDSIVNNLPMIGGFVGGTLGATLGIPTLGLTSAPAAIAGASILGAGGESIRQLVQRMEGKESPSSSGEAAKRIGIEGAIQGAAEGSGQVLKAGAKALGKTFLKHAIPVDADTLRESPRIYESIAKTRTPLSQAGYEGIDQKVKASYAKKLGVVKDFEDAFPNATMPIDQLTDSVNKTADKIFRTENADPVSRRNLEHYVEEILRNPSNGAELSPTRLEEIRDAAASKASTLFDAAKKGATVKDDFGMSMRADVAGAAKKQLEAWITKGVVPSATESLSTLNAKTHDLASVRAAIKDALDHYAKNPRSPIARHGLGAMGGAVGNLAGGPAGAAAGIAGGELLASPRVEAAIGRSLLNEGQELPYSQILRLLTPFLDPYRKPQ
jgi:hypothetical protein